MWFTKVSKCLNYSAAAEMLQKDFTGSNLSLWGRVKTEKSLRWMSESPDHLAGTRVLGSHGPHWGLLPVGLDRNTSTVASSGDWELSEPPQLTLLHILYINNINANTLSLAEFEWLSVKRLINEAHRRYYLGVKKRKPKRSENMSTSWGESREIRDLHKRQKLW